MSKIECDICCEDFPAIASALGPARKELRKQLRSGTLPYVHLYVSDSQGKMVCWGIPEAIKLPPLQEDLGTLGSLSSCPSCDEGDSPTAGPVVRAFGPFDMADPASKKAFDDLVDQDSDDSGKEGAWENKNYHSCALLFNDDLEGDYWVCRDRNLY